MHDQKPRTTETTHGDCPECHRHTMQLLRHDAGSDHRFCYGCSAKWDTPC